MVMNNIEQIMARRQVDMEIKSDPVMIQFYRREKVSDGAGGYILAPSTPTGGAVEVLIMPAKRRMSAMQVNTELGDVIDYAYVVLARHTADIREDDTFSWEGDEFQIESIHIKTQVSVTAMVNYFGGTKNG